jgi:NAD(P)-dependent dehydrogenase (short-subunit alcohol dehydrogenase family)
MPRLEGRTAIVTGGAKGIGVHYCNALAAEIAAKHGRNSTDSMVFDVSDEAQCKALVAKTMERFGKIDILINNAALYAPLPTLSVTDIDVELWDKVMGINIRGPFLMVKHVAPHMKAKRYGKIVNIGSGTAARGIPDFSHYVTSKGAVTAFTRCISRELGDHGICVNTLAPGYTLSDTGMTNAVHVEKSKAQAVARRAIKRDEHPEDLLGTLIFLCSSDSDFMTGQVLAIDGGTNNT